jgi:predicted transcriptional regulator
MKSNRKLRQIARVILENPGISKAQISYLTGLSYNYVRNALANLESYGIFLSEDENAKLYPFNDYNPDNIPDE